MRCSIIRRVSTEKQAEKISLTDQLKQCKKSIELRGWTFIRDFNFESTHGYELKTHPLYADLRQHIINDECDVILTAVLDRTLRDTNFWVDLCTLLQKHNKLIASPSEVFDPKNLEHELTLNIKSAIGHFERKKIAERAKMGLDALKDNGKWTGGVPPFGYYWDMLDKENPVKIHSDEASILKRILDMMLKFPKTEICEILNSEKIPCRSNIQWSPRMLRRLTEKKRLAFYAGMRMNSKGILREAVWQQIITKEEYIRYIDAKKARKKAYHTNPSYLLTGLGIFRCGYCGLSVKSATNAARENSYIYYYCTGYYRGRNFCQNSKAIRMQLIDDIVINDIIKRVIDLSIIEKGYQALSEDNDKSKIESDLRKQLAAAMAKRDRLINAVENDLLSYSEIEDRMKKVRQDIHLVETKLNELYSDSVILEPELIYDRQKAILKIDNYDLEAKREIISLLIEKIILFQDKLHIIYRFPVTRSGEREIKITINKKPNKKV